MRHLFFQLTHWVSGLDAQGWIFLGVIGVGVGFFCLRGFGSRTTY